MNETRTQCRDGSLSVIIPALNAERSLTACLDAVALAGARLGEVIVVDGGSQDATVERAESAGAGVITAPRGRGVQLAAGADAATGAWLLFLHADTVLDPSWPHALDAHIATRPDQALAFRFALDDDARAARRLERMVAWRCAVFRLPYGDQGLLISRTLYDAVGGYSQWPLFEDVDLVRRIGRRRLTMSPVRAVTSAERFKAEGYIRRPLRNLWLLARYFAGARPEALARAYRR